jgi:hypothetical protein
MVRVANLFKLAGAAALGVALAGGCGGKSQSDGADDNSDSGNSDSGNSDSGDGNATATGGKGSTNPGGTDSGARDDEGGTSSTGATTGRAGSPSRPGCEGPSAMDPNAPGGCAAIFLNWTHDAETGLCMPILYGGCGATENNYESLAECQTACRKNRPINLDECASGSDCALTLASCCGPSGPGPGYTAHDFVAYAPQHQGQLDLCKIPTCTDPPEDVNGERKYFVPECVQNECVVTDLRTSELTSCETTDDCRLRMGSGCCEGCGDLIAVRNDGSFEKQVCGDTIPPCPPCVGTPPPDSVSAVCIDGRCSVAYEIVQ